jgi:hypothetical protein
LGALLVLAVAILTGFFSGYGRLTRSHEVTHAFETNHIFPEHRYYIMGIGFASAAIVGIDRNYKLQARFWREVDLSKIEVKDLLERMINRDGYSPRGFFILDTKGKKIGVYYSSVYWAAIKIEDGNKIVMLSPHISAGGRR